MLDEPRYTVDADGESVPDLPGDHGPTGDDLTPEEVMAEAERKTEEWRANIVKWLVDEHLIMCGRPQLDGAMPPAVAGAYLEVIQRRIATAVRAEFNRRLPEPF